MKWMAGYAEHLLRAVREVDERRGEPQHTEHVRRSRELFMGAPV